MHLPLEVQRLIACKEGLIAHEQAVALGLSEWTVQRRVRSGEWDRVRPRVYLVGGHLFTDPARVRGAGLWAGPRAAVSGQAAAFWLDMLPSAPDRIEVTVPRRRGLRSHADVRVRRRDLHPLDRHRSRGIWHTNSALTVLETAISVPDGAEFLDRALQKHVPFDDAYRAYCRNLGARGSARIAALLIVAADRADSAAERPPTLGRHPRLATGCALRALDDRPRLPRRTDRHRDRRLGLAHGPRPVPQRPAQGERPRPRGLDPPALHLARPDQPPRLRPRRDPRRTPHRRHGMITNTVRDPATVPGKRAHPTITERSGPVSAMLAVDTRRAEGR